MNLPIPDFKNKQSQNVVIHYAAQLLALSLILIWCFKIIEPFLTIIIWGAVFAITLYPVYHRLTEKLKGKKILSASLIIVIMLMIIIAPAIGLMLATVDEFKILSSAFKSGELAIGLPNKNVEEWPIIGPKIYQYWTEASNNFTSFISDHKDQIKPVLLKIFDLMSSAGKGVLVLFASIIASGIFLVYAIPAGNFFKTLLIKLAGKNGETMTAATALTVRNVAKGVVGVSFIQAILAGIGMVIAGVPFAGLWTLICLVLAIVQLGILPVSLGVIIYIWSTGSTFTAILLTVWMLFLGVIDNILKPIMMGKGAPAPMLVVFIGTIGGFISNGFIGLFTGAIIFTIAYNLILGWVYNKPETNQEEAAQAVHPN